jgi:hypothetical protein
MGARNLSFASEPSRPEGRAGNRWRTISTCAIVTRIETQMTLFEILSASFFRSRLFESP